MKSLRFLAAAFSLAPFAPVSAQCDPFQIAWTQDTYQPRVQVVLQMQGEPGSHSALLLEPGSGPTELPGIGSLDVSVTRKLVVVFLPAMPESGVLELVCSIPCGFPYIGVPLQSQVVNLDPDSLQLCISNPATLNIVDGSGVCSAHGCGVPFWMYTLSAWGPTGFHPDEEFDGIFGIDLLGHGVSLLQALGSTGSPGASLAAQAVAALLNAAHPDGHYSLSVAAVFQEVYEGVTSGQLGATQAHLESLNSLGCHL